MKSKTVVLVVVGLVVMLSTIQISFSEDGNSGVENYASLMNSSSPIPAGHFALLANYANKFLTANNGTGGHRTIYAESLMDGVDDPTKADEITDYYLLDIRRKADFDAGHIQGAVNVQLAEVADPKVLAMLPTDKPILIICYTGHTASIANAILGTLGYDAWTLRFGMTSWKEVSPTAVYSSNVKQDIVGGNYPIEPSN